MYVWDDEQEQMAGRKKPRAAFEAKLMDSPSSTRGGTCLKQFCCHHAFLSCCSNTNAQGDGAVAHWLIAAAI